MTFDVRNLDIVADKKRVKNKHDTRRKSNAGRKGDPVIIGYVERFEKFKPGQSFFIAGAAPADLEFLRRPILKAGMGVIIRAMVMDPIHKCAGTRVWRQSGPFDDL